MGGEAAAIWRGYRRDGAGNVVPGGTVISDVINEALTTGAWTAISLIDNPRMGCKAIVAKMRDGSDWKLSLFDDGTRYATVTGSLTMDIAKGPGEVLFYAQASVNGTLEVILLD